MTATPKRIQLRRTKGWRKPEGAIVVARPSKWGNWYRITSEGGRWHVGHASAPQIESRATKAEAVALAVAWFREDWLVASREPQILDELRGHDLACWCPLDQPCHADVLLELANEDNG